MHAHRAVPLLFHKARSGLIVRMAGIVLTCPCIADAATLQFVADVDVLNLPTSGCIAGKQITGRQHGQREH